MTNAFVEKLQKGVGMSESDRRRLIDVTARTETISANTHLFREGDVLDGAYVLLSGFAYCFKLLTNGERQIVACRVPGDAEGLYGIPTESADYTVVTLTTSTVAFIPRDTIDSLIADHPSIARSLWWSVLMEKGYLCASLTNIGQRPAPQRLAHLICELLSRLQAVGLARSGSFEMPMTQQDFADFLGITSVHTCRVFRQLRQAGLVSYNGRTISVSNFDRLKIYSDFNLVIQ